MGYLEDSCRSRGVGRKKWAWSELCEGVPEYHLGRVRLAGVVHQGATLKSRGMGWCVGYGFVCMYSGIKGVILD